MPSRMRRGCCAWRRVCRQRHRHYIFKTISALCGDCPQYNTIAQDVETLVTWRSRAERQLIARVLQAFSTYNEAIGYDAAMIPMADECLSVWCGDEDQAFKTFVLLHDEIPFLCASAA
ncbi:hypothetical protein PINS_up020468 [Pythium insidiosum]|nr:hypothetical protein PINS_up020468 [Pythium insidiosum]